MRRLVVAAIVILGLATPAWAFDTRASSAFVVDHNTGTVLLNKNADTPLPPASMSKLMTLYVAFEAIRAGKLKMTEELVVSEHAHSFGGSTMFLNIGERVTVEDLIRGIIVLSGNDACVVLAETLSPDGTEAGFARMMTRRAIEMGMTNSTFMNSSGWPQDGHVMSMRDLALLARRLIVDFPEFYPMFAEREFLFDAKESQNRWNRNPLLRMDIGADGLKTGHTQEAGYGLVGSAKQGNRRVVFVISGLASQQTRSEEAQSIVNWAFRQFAEREMITAGTRVAEADVWMGEAQKVGLVPAEDKTVLMPVSNDEDVKAEVVFQSPIQAPIAKGQQLGELVFTPDGLEEVRVPLVAEADVAAGGFMTRITTAAMVLVKQFTEGAGTVDAPAAEDAS